MIPKLGSGPNLIWGPRNNPEKAWKFGCYSKYIFNHESKLNFVPTYLQKIELCLTKYSYRGEKYNMIKVYTPTNAILSLFARLVFAICIREPKIASNLKLKKITVY